MKRNRIFSLIIITTLVIIFFIMIAIQREIMLDQEETRNEIRNVFLK